MKKRILAVSLTAALMLSTFAACSNDTANDSSNDASTDNSADASTDEGVDLDAIEVPDEIDLYVYYADTSLAIVDEALANIAKKYPDLKVNIEHRSDADGAVLQTRAAVGELPDSFECVNSVTIPMYESGDLAPLDDTMAAMDYYSYFDATAFDGKKIDDVTYAIQINKNESYLVFYNKTVLADNGIEEPTNYEEFTAAVNTLSDAGIIPFALFGTEQWPGAQLYDMAVIGSGEVSGCVGLDTGATTITDEAYVEGAEKIQALVDAGMFGSGALSTNASQAFEMLQLGQAGFMGNGSWYFFDCGEYKDNIGYLEYNPFCDKGEENKTAASAGAPDLGGFAASATGDKVDFAKVFTLEFVKERHAAEYSLGGGVCRLTDVPECQIEMSEAHKAFCESVPNFTSTTQFVNWGLSDTELMVTLSDQIETLVMGTVDAPTFIDNVSSMIG